MIENRAGLKNVLSHKFGHNVQYTTIYLSNIISTKSGGKYSYKLLLGCKLRLSLSLRAFSEVSVVTTKDKIQGKLKNRGTTWIFIGYIANHSRDVFQMLNLETYEIIHSRDIVWLKRCITNKLKMIKITCHSLRM